MTEMTDSPILRRTTTVMVVVILFVAVTVLSPVLLAVAAIVDVARLVTSKRPWVTIRCLAFLWVYLLGEIWAVLALGLTAPLPKKARLHATFRLQGAWARWNLGALERIFDLEIEVEGEEHIRPGPIVVLVRHASMVDTLLPANIIARPFGIRLRYVLKKELLVDPALDIAGNRLPNYFVDRSNKVVSEIDAIRALASGLDADEGVLIYPEGTRFSESKQRRLTARFERQGGRLAEIATGYRTVLPPRPGGTLALLDATTGDVVILVHHGLEGLATVKEIWAGGLVGSRISVGLWRVPREEIPSEKEAQQIWLFETWATVDDWVASKSEQVT